MAALNQYEKGDKIRMSVAFDNGATPPVATDPTDVYFLLHSPEGVTVLTYHYGVDIQLVKDSTGNYHVDYKATETGQYGYNFSGVGGVDRAKTGYFNVITTGF